MTAVTLAAVRLAPVLGDVEGNRARAVAAIGDATSRGADLVVLPELTTSGYCFADADEALASAEPVPGPTTDAWSAVAAESGAVVVGGVCELDGDGAVRNTAVVVGPDGLLARYRKLHLWGRETELFTTGDAAPPVVDTPAGRIGIGVCYDLWFPEHARGLALAGADILAFPSNLSHSPSQDGLPHLDVVTAVATAHVNRVHLVVADRCGTERGHRWLGASLIVDAEGTLCATVPDDDRPATALATLDRAAARQALGRVERRVGRSAAGAVRARRLVAQELAA